MRIGMVRWVDRRAGIPLCWALSRLLRRGGPSLRPPRKILLMKWVGFGNLILASPAVSALRARYPGAEIAFVTLRANRGLLERYPTIDRVYYFDVSSLRSVLRETLRLLAFVRREAFDVVVDFEQFSRYSALMAGLSGAPVRAGFDTPGQHRGGVYTHRVTYRDGVHMADVFADLARALGAAPDATELVAPLATPEDRARAARFLGEEGLLQRPFVVIHPGTGENAPQRRWPPDRFAELADRVIRETGMAVVFSGAPRDRENVETVMACMVAPAASTAGRLTLGEFAALLQRAHLLVCGDTGPVHLAAALRVPTVAFYGPNDPRLYGPLGNLNAILYKNLPCSPCITNFNDKTTRCPHGNCIQSITVEEMYLAIQQHPAREPATRNGDARHRPASAGSERVV